MRMNLVQREVAEDRSQLVTEDSLDLARLLS